MITNAERMVKLADTFGDLPLNNAGQTTNKVLNLSIPCARLVVAGVVPGVADTNDGLNDNALKEVELRCRQGVELAQRAYGIGWWTQEANALLGVVER